MKLRAWLAALLLTGTAQAGDRLAVTRVAFNTSGSRALVMVQGTQDASDFPVARLHLLNTSTGRMWQAASLSRNTGLTAHALMLALLKAQQPALQQQGYASGKTAVPRFKRSFPATLPSWQEGVGAGQTEQNSVKLWSKTVPVSLQVLPARTPCKFMAQLPEGQVPARVVLRVNGQSVAATAVPCAARYSLERVDVKGNRALFTLRAYTPGFEGPDAEPLFLATTLQ